jgi:hypothetical protein
MIELLALRVLGYARRVWDCMLLDVGAGALNWQDLFN